MEDITSSYFGVVLFEVGKEFLSYENSAQFCNTGNYGIYYLVQVS